MTPEKLARLAVLQDRERAPEPMGNELKLELANLRRELAMAPEVADDKSTPFTDESRRPMLDGTDWNDMNHAAACNEVVTLALRLAATVGKAGAEVALNAGLAALKGR